MSMKSVVSQHPDFVRRLGVPDLTMGGYCQLPFAPSTTKQDGTGAGAHLTYFGGAGARRRGDPQPETRNPKEIREPKSESET